MSRLVNFGAVPAFLVSILVVGLVVQLILPTPTSSFAPAFRAARSRAPSAPVVTPIAEDAAIQSLSLFSPNRTAAVTTSGAPEGPLLLVGLATGAGRPMTVLQTADGAAHMVPLGGELNGWRVQAASDVAVTLARGDQTQTLRLGAPAAPLGTAGRQP